MSDDDLFDALNANMKYAEPMTQTQASRWVARWLDTRDRISQLEQALGSANQEAQLQRESCVQLEQALQEAQTARTELARVYAQDIIPQWREREAEAIQRAEKAEQQRETLDQIQAKTQRERDEARAERDALLEFVRPIVAKVMAEDADVIADVAALRSIPPEHLEAWLDAKPAAEVLAPFLSTQQKDNQ